MSLKTEHERVITKAQIVGNKYERSLFYNAVIQITQIIFGSRVYSAQCG